MQLLKVISYFTTVLFITVKQTIVAVNFVFPTLHSNAQMAETSVLLFSEM